MRNAVNQAGRAYNTAVSTAATLGGEGQGIASTLTPYLTSELLHPQGLGQEGIGAEEAAAFGGTGGANAGLVGQATQRAAASRNAGGYQAALAEAARQRDKAAAQGAESIMAQNENLKQEQSARAGQQLQGLYGTDTSGMLNAMGQEAPDINAEVNAGKSGWLQNTLGIINSIKGASKGPVSYV